MNGVEFASAPLKVITDEREFVDDEKLNIGEMIGYLSKYKGKSKSSCLNTEDYDGSIQGVIKEIDDGGMLIERTSGGLEIINFDFVTRIREYPRKKNGKKKDVVLD